MGSELEITASAVDPGLLDLPWRTPLEEWPSEAIAALPKGISRHIVRFARLGEDVAAVKETQPALAMREFDLLKTLQRLSVPCVEPVAVIENRRSRDGRELPAALVTRHLRFSLPYRALFANTLRPETATRLVDALALLLVRLHVEGFFWGDVSLSNALFRRDAGAFAAYLVDAETGSLHEDGLSKARREYDLEIARVNVAGEMLDLAAGGRVDDALDPVAVGDSLVRAYRSLWDELTGAQTFDTTERWRIGDRVRRLNDLGFDIEELAIRTDPEGTSVRIQPKVVDAGHHQRRLFRLTGLDAEENQARRLLNDLDEYVANHRNAGVGEEMLAHEWLTEVFEPVVAAIPRELQSKLEPAEVFHQLLDHRWYLAQERSGDVPMAEAISSYIDTVLRHRADEVTVLESPLQAQAETEAETEAETLGLVIRPDERGGTSWRDRV